MVEIIQFLLVGAFSGFVAGLFGVGGGLILVPFLLFTLHGNVESEYLMHTAVGTSLGIIIFTSISSVRAHHKHKAIDWGSF
ncbi:MAG: sulfite exporter TauE/SafE family protein, partial [Gammaproteobacteria bacterium]